MQTSEVPEEGLAETVQEAMQASAAAGAQEPVARSDGRPRSINCQLPWFTMYIKPNGEVQPCPVHPPIGNILASSLAEINRGAAMTELRTSLRQCPKEICVECRRLGVSGVGV